MIAAFSPQQVCRLAGLTTRQLFHWDKTGFFPPAYADDVRGRPFGRIYSFKDVVALRALAVLRNKYRLPLQQLRELGIRLSKQYAEPWSELVFHMRGQQLFYDDPASGVRMSASQPGQMAIPFEMRGIEDEMALEVAKLRERSPDERGRIVRHRYVMSNKPVFAGTRIPSEAILSFHDAGYTVDQIIREYPSLTPADIEAAIRERHKLVTREAG